jgi:arylsulfatase A-like enzyme
MFVKAIMLMFDSLNRHMLPTYGCDWVHAPNFRRLAERTAVFDRSYVGSMPCMPARREIHTGRYNFLHRGWGPIEPFDDSMPEILKNNGVSTHLISDHYHYWEEGGCTYHTRYSTWDAIRGQEGDPWKANLTDEVKIPENLNRRGGGWGRQDWVNRHYMERQEDHYQHRTFTRGLEFLRTNAGADNWLLHLETFDPHEPYFVPQKYVDLYRDLDPYDGPVLDWPPYSHARDYSPEQIQHLRVMNAALISMCDDYLGQVLATMDELHLWEDTMLIVHTDHGFMLAEHDSWAKCWCPFWEEISHTPLFIWDPRSRVAGQRRDSLVQTIDLAPTMLEYFGIDRTADMQGSVLRDTIANDASVREAGLFGIFGGHVNVTDGRHVYMRAPVLQENKPLYEYTHMPTHMRHTFGVQQMRTMTVSEPLSFTKGCPVMRIDGHRTLSELREGRAMETMLFDLEEDPTQDRPLQNAALESRMIDHLVRLMKQNEAPAEQLERLGLSS